MSHLLCFGLGYSAAVIGQRLKRDGWTVSGTSRRPEGLAGLNAQGFNGLVFDGQQRSRVVADVLPGVTHILLSIPPDHRGDPALLLHGADIAASPSIEWIGYFSTVGVYGDAAGGWVDETTEARPASERGQRRLDAERAWQALGAESHKPTIVFRLPGIYGPGRSAIEDMIAGTARRIVKPGQVFNRIHVEDIANTVLASIDRPSAVAVYNVTDDLPGPPQDVVAFAAELLGLPVPPDIDFATASLSEMARSFYSESKRVSNALMKSELGVRLRFPTYREGLAAIAAAAQRQPETPL